MERERLPSLKTLSSLPNELILHILRTFCLHCRDGSLDTPRTYSPATKHPRGEPCEYFLDVYALHSMSLVSRRFSALAQEILYHEFIPAYGEACFGLQSDPSECDLRLVHFLRIVALNPGLAALVKRVYVSTEFLDRIPEAEAEAEAVLKDVAQSRNIKLSEFVGSFRDQWDPESRDQYRPAGDEMLGMLLACLPRLKTLSLSGTPPRRGVPVSALRAAGVSALSIETLDINVFDHTLNQELDGVLELASSTIKNLCIDGCDVYRRSLLTGQGHFPNLRNLRIVNSRVIGSDLASFLSHCFRLQEFSYGCDLGCDDLLPSDAVKHLIRNKESLQTLHLDHDDQCSASNRGHLAKLLAGLNSFPVLRNLLLSSRLLYHSTGGSTEDDNVLTRLLPPSIVSLQVTVAKDRVVDVLPRLGGGLLRLAQAVSQGRFPNLKRVTLNGYALDIAFAGAGVVRLRIQGFDHSITVGLGGESLPGWFAGALDYPSEL
ncbi:hypothetical protein C8A03DRAFT_34999 [Achaetomium macrosporum]|uniref:Uncharacterized protein n=1 Tax=Achaetomium macrosporum TaxID=79813 RepID=A0AAN7C9W0_9PEZI|nr:hypothetical protein C8A03DRAFT_34999 [Achaetomium macrosporum]